MPSEFDQRAATWDDDVRKGQRAQTAAACIRGHVPLDSRTRVFEYGCGTGLLSFALRPWVGEMTLADSSDGMIEVVRGKIAAAGENRMRALQVDLTSDPAPEGPFDLVCTLMALHHVSRLDPVLAAFHTVLAPAGWLCIVDLDKEDGSFHGAGFTGHSGFDRAALGALLAAHGFRVTADEQCFTIGRQTPQGRRVYPVFLTTARRLESA